MAENTNLVSDLVDEARYELPYQITTAKHQAKGFIEQTLPRRYARARLDSYVAYHPNQAPVLARIREIADDIERFVAEGRNLVLFGTAGTGKDHLLAGLLCRAYRACVRPLAWFAGHDLWDGKLDPTELSRRHGVVVISDPIAPTGSLPDWRLANLFNFVDTKYAARVPIWTSLNAIDLDDAKDRLTVPVFERLVEDAVVLECRWPSYRTKDMSPVIGAKKG